MFNKFKKDLTLQECEKVEAEKLEKIRLADEEIASLKKRNDDLLPDISDGNVDANVEVQKNKKRISDLEDEKNAHNAFLARVLPVQKNRARALEIEALIPEIEKLDAQFSSFVADINKKAAALVESNESFHKFLKKFDGFEATSTLGFSKGFVSYGLGGISRNSLPDLISHSDPITIDVRIVLMAAVYDKERFAAWVEKTRSTIAERITRMHDHAMRLKGEDLPKPTYPYCSNCYELTQWPDKNGKVQCSHCRKTVDAVC